MSWLKMLVAVINLRRRCHMKTIVTNTPGGSAGGAMHCGSRCARPGWRMDGRKHGISSTSTQPSILPGSTALEMPLGIDPRGDVDKLYSLLPFFRPSGLTLGHRCIAVTHLDRNRRGRNAGARSDPMGQTWYCIDPAVVVNSFTAHMIAAQPPSAFMYMSLFRHVIGHNYYGVLPQEALLLWLLWLSVCLSVAERL